MDASRKKSNLQEVLKFSVAHTQNGTEQEECDSTTNGETDGEKTEFLQNALKSMTFDATYELKTALAILEGSTDMEQKLESLEIIREHIADIDLANSLVKMGGTKLLLRHIRESDGDLKSLSTYIVGEMAQNNTFCQDSLMKENVIPLIVPNMNDSDKSIAKSSVYAISSLIRNFPPGLEEFLRINGIDALLSCLRSTDADVYIKAAFLIASLSSRDKSVREMFVKQNAVPLLLNSLECITDFDVKQETTLFALSALSQECKWKLPLENRKEAEVILKQIISVNIASEDCRDMVDYARNTLENLKKYSPLV